MAPLESHHGGLVQPRFPDPFTGAGLASRKVPRSIPYRILPETTGESARGTIAVAARPSAAVWPIDRSRTVPPAPAVPRRRGHACELGEVRIRELFP
jgi:hypothetical protein